MYMYKVVFTDNTWVRIHADTPRKAWKVAELIYHKEAMRIEYKGRF